MMGFDVAWSILSTIKSYVSQVECRMLYDLVAPDMLCVDVGVGRGRTTAVMGMAGAKVIAISTWDEPSEGDRRDFEETCAKALISPMTLQMTSLHGAEVVTGLRLQPDIVLIDSNHAYASVRDDIAAWSPIVKAGGLMVFHDMGSSNWPGVTKAVIMHLEGWPLVQCAGYLYAYRRPQ